MAVCFESIQPLIVILKSNDLDPPTITVLMNGTHCQMAGLRGGLVNPMCHANVSM